jgi:hypothetical protein
MDDESTLTFRIMKEPIGTLGYVPLWWMQQFDAQARKNHCDQSINRLLQRGGLIAREAWAVATGRPWRSVEGTTEAIAWEELKRLVEIAQPGWKCGI